MTKIETIRFENDTLILLDQRKLPGEVGFYCCKTAEEVAFAISDMVVRGAPAIGAAAAYGVLIAATELKKLPKDQYFIELLNACALIRSARPTAVNLMWAVDRMKSVIMLDQEMDIEKQLVKLKEEALAIHKEDVVTCENMAKYGAELIRSGDTILTHCNTGALATAGMGTALGVIMQAHKDGKNIKVFADETRPRLQGARLTAWELVNAGVPSKLIADSVAAPLIRDGKIDIIFVGADRIAANGDTANKIGTFMLSVLAKTYKIPFYIVAPTTTIDFNIKRGQDIEIEERSWEEVTHIGGVQIAPSKIEVYNPAFDVTPHDNITGIITEKGILYPPYHEAIKKLKL